MLYANDLAVDVVDSEADLQERLLDWKEIFDKHELRVSLEKTGVIWVEQQKKDLDIRLDGKKLNQQDSFIYLGERFARTAARIWKFAGDYKLGQVRGGKWDIATYLES